MIGTQCFYVLKVAGTDFDRIEVLKMKVVLQRSKAASVTVHGKVTGAIDKGYVLLVGITHEDTTEDVAYLAKK